MCIRWLMNLSDSAKMHGATIRFIDVTCFIIPLFNAQHVSDVLTSETC